MSLRNLLIFCLFFYVPGIYAANYNDIAVSAAQWMTSNKIPGMSIAIYNNGELSNRISLGHTTLDDGLPITAHTMFQIGSITKTFTAAAILKLESQGKLSIDDKIGKYFPEYPRWKNITIRQLLNMTSGIYRYMHDKTFIAKYKRAPQATWNNSELLNIAYTHPDYFKPGKGWHYSNTNYILLGEIIQKITAKNISEVFDEEFIHPLHLNDTMFAIKKYPTSIISRIAYGYHNSDDVTDYSMSAFGAAGAMLSTPTDIGKWINALFIKKTVLPEKQLQQLMKTVPFNDARKPKGCSFGLGVYYCPTLKFGKAWWYSGVTNGYISLFLWLPDREKILVVTINRISNNDYWVLMPDKAFIENLISAITSSSRATG